MKTVERLLEKMQTCPTNIRFKELNQVCEHFLGKPRQKRSSHCIYKTPWPGDPRVNIQNAKGKAKAYQVKQVLIAIKKLKEQTNA